MCSRTPIVLSSSCRRETDQLQPEPSGPPADGPSDPYAVPAACIAANLQVQLDAGLTQAEAERRLARDGRNELESRQREPVWRMVLETALEPFVILLAVAGGLALLLGEIRDGLLVLAGLIPIVVADVLTEYRSERALDALRSAAAPSARVRRDGSVRDLAAGELVVGDIVQIQTGDVLPADVRLWTVAGVQLDRSILTGEALPEAGNVEPDAAGAALADRHSIAYAGTAVVGGRAEGIVVATGQRTELGRIAGGLQPRERRRSPLQRELDRLVRILVVVAVGLIAITVGLGFLRGQTLAQNVLAGISAAIAAIPEEPPVLLAVILGLGAYRLLKRGVLVRRLSAQETLGAIDLILTDKTGTLTENRLELDHIATPDGPLADGAARAAVTLDALRAEDDAWRLDSGARAGSFTRALIGALGELGVDAHLDPSDLLDARPAGDGAAYAWTRARGPGGEIQERALGAPEAVLGLCSGELSRWEALTEHHAAEGSRLVLLATRGDGGMWVPQALIAFADHVRDGVPDALRRAVSAGIQTVVVTGDHRSTASAIASAAGVPRGTTITGEELAGWDDDRLRTELAGLSVVARATPNDKLRLVDAARALGRTVAVTGDGVNDAPALQRSDVAVAMGSGTAVARGASDLILGDDSFVTLLDGLAEGRRMVDNVLKGLVFLLSTHVALLGFILIATLDGFAQPLVPLQILWLELFIDISASIAFEREPPEPDVMRRPPRRADLPLLTRGLLARIGVAGSFTAVAALAIMATQPGDPEHARWLAYTVLVVGQAVRGYSNRSLSVPVWRRPANALLGVCCLAVVAIQVLIPSIPAISEAFHAVPLLPADLLTVAALALAPSVVVNLLRARGVSGVA